MYVHVRTHVTTHSLTHSACLFRYILPDFACKPVVVMWLYLNLGGKEGKTEKKEKEKKVFFFRLPGSQVPL